MQKPKNSSMLLESGNEVHKNLQLVNLLHQVMAIGSRERHAAITSFDPWAYAAYLPDRGEKLRDLKLAAKKLIPEIKQGKARSFSILFGRELKRHILTQDPSGGQALSLSASFFSELIFFVSHGDFVDCAQSVAGKLNYAVIRHSHGVVICHDTFRLHLDFSLVIARMLGGNTSMKDVLMELMADLPRRFDRCELIAKHFNQHSEQIVICKNGLLGIATSQGYCELAYQNISDLFTDKAELQDFLNHSDVNDFFNEGGVPVFTVRSLLHPVARPTAVHTIHDGWCLSFDREIKGRLTPLEGYKSKQFLTYHHYLAQKYIDARKFQARVIKGQDVRAKGIFLLGDKIASVLYNPQLVRGIIQALSENMQAVWYASSRHENMLMLVEQSDYRDQHSRLIKLGKHLTSAVMPDGADPIELEIRVDPSHLPAGQFELNLVPAEFFELMRVVDRTDSEMPAVKLHYLRGLALELIHEWRQASRSFMRAFRLDRSDHDVCFALGRTLRDQHKNDEALFFLKHAQQLSPQRADICNLLGLVYLEKGSMAEAASALEQAVSMSPTETQYLIDLGRCYFLLGAFKEAKIALECVLQQSADEHEAHLLLAEISFQDKNYDKALSHAVEATTLRPTDHQITDLLSKLDDLNQNEDQ